jgi:ankyrin repeat protein
MTAEEAAAQVGTQLLRNLHIFAEGSQNPISNDIRESIQEGICQSIRDDGVVGSLLIIALALAGLEWPVRLLLEKGANIETKSKRSANVQMPANMLFAPKVNPARKYNLVFGNRVHELEMPFAYSQTALIVAAGRGHEAVVRRLLERGANIEATDTKASTAVMLAASGGHTATVKLLLKEGAKIEATDVNGSTALRFAAGRGHQATVKLLLEEGAKVDAANKIGSTALIFSAGAGHLATVQLLLEKGAGVDAVDKNGFTALILAVNRGHVAGEEVVRGYEAIVRLLVEKGANTKLRTRHGQAAEDYTTSNTTMWQALNSVRSE